MSKMIQQAIIPEFKDLMISTTGTLSEIQDLMTKNFGETIHVTPFVNAYLALCALAKNGLFEQNTESTLAKIK